MLRLLLVVCALLAWPLPGTVATADGPGWVAAAAQPDERADDDTAGLRARGRGEPPPSGRPLLREFRYDPGQSRRSHSPLLAKAALLALLVLAQRRLRTRPAPWPPILGTGCVLLAVNLLLDSGGVALSYVPHAFGGRAFTAPLFAYVAPAFSPAVLAHLLWVGGLLAFGLPRLLAPGCGAPIFGLAVYATALGTPILLGLSSDWPVVLRQFFASGLDYVDHVRPLAATGALLAGYVDAMPGLSVHASTHGPGPLLGLALLQTVTGESAVATAIGLQALGALLPLVTWLSARRVLDEAPARLAGVLVLLSPSFQLFSFVSMEGVFAVLLFGTAALVVRSLLATRLAPAWAIGLGVMGYVSAFWTFSASFLGPFALVTGALAIRRGQVSLPHALQTGVWALAGFAAVHLAMLALGFDLWACFERARELNTEMMGSAWRSPGHYLWGALGTLAAFAIGCGVPVTGLWLSGLRRFASERSAASCVFWGGSATVLLLGVMGLYQWEVERIWLFLVPLVCLPAARHLWELDGDRPRRVAAVAAVLWIQTVLMELLLETYW